MFITHTAAVATSGVSFGVGVSFAPTSMFYAGLCMVLSIAALIYAKHLEEAQ